MFVTHRHLLRARRPAPARGAADLLPLLLLAAAACASAQVVTPTARSRATVGIVGAGMSGIRAATVLADSGVDYVVLEADSKVGGRMRNTEIAPGQVRARF
jgi:heterodisulfide reductase subunit A-like polyferredoxin